MGLLTDPNSEQGKITKGLLKYYNQICILLYIGGLLWFCALASREINANTYFSENALLPGLVKSEFFEDTVAKRVYKELIDEMKKYDNSIPYPWLLAKFKQMGLDTYTHNFTLNYPLGKTQKFYGKNVYGILRAARASSTEALVLSVPYRPPINPHLPTAPSIAILLAFANFANKQKYWAKDIIFLVTEHEQLGVQAWLEAYYGVQCGEDNTLESGDLDGRAGAIQAAINLEMHDTNIAQIDIKIEGLNGQLPNLDLFNLVAKMCTKEGVYNTFKNRESKNLRDPIKDWAYSMHTLLLMISSQASGIPNGNHGLFHRFGIESLTIEGFPYDGKGNNWKVEFLIIGRILEGIFRSLNNLLERFHQSFFFYLLPSSNKFISIGLYFPTIGALAGALYIKACAKWCQLQEDSEDTKKKSKKKKVEHEPPHIENEEDKDKFMAELGNKFKKEIKEVCINDDDYVQMGHILTVFITSHVVGILIMNSPQYLVNWGGLYGYSKEVSIFYGFIQLSLISLITPMFIRFQGNEKTISILNIVALLECGTFLICIGMNNFSLGLLCGVIYVPFAVSINRTYCRSLQRVLWSLVHPLVVLIVIVMINTYVMFPGKDLQETFYRGLNATQQAIVYGIVDYKIYGNWLFSVISAILIPNWLCFWIVTFASRPKTPIVSLEKKNN